MSKTSAGDHARAASDNAPATKKDLSELGNRIAEEISVQIHDLTNLLAERFDKVDRRFESHEQRFDDMDRRFDHLDLYQERLAAGQGRIESKLDVLTDRVDKHAVRIEKLEQSAA